MVLDGFSASLDPSNLTSTGGVLGDEAVVTTISLWAFPV